MYKKYIWIIIFNFFKQLQNIYKFVIKWFYNIFYVVILCNRSVYVFPIKWKHKFVKYFLSFSVHTNTKVYERKIVSSSSLHSYVFSNTLIFLDVSSHIIPQRQFTKHASRSICKQVNPLQNMLNYALCLVLLLLATHKKMTYKYLAICLLSSYMENRV